MTDIGLSAGGRTPQRVWTHSFRCPDMCSAHPVSLGRTVTLSVGGLVSTSQDSPSGALCAPGHSFPIVSFRAHTPFITCTHTPHSISILPEARASSPSPLRVPWRLRSFDRFFYCAPACDHLLTHTIPFFRAQITLIPRPSPQHASWLPLSTPTSTPILISIP